MNKQTEEERAEKEAKDIAKDILGLLTIVLPIFILTFVWWLNSPLYAAEKEAERYQAQQILLQTYNLGDAGPYNIDREELIERYGFTEEEINPNSLFDEFKSTSPVAETEPLLYVPPNYYYIGVMCFMAPWGIAFLVDYIKKRRGRQDE